MYSTRNTERNNIQVALIRNAFIDFNNKINSISENETRFEQPNETVNIGEKILEFNRQQSGQGLKILTPDQMLNRLPIPLAQLKVRNNSKKNLKMKSDNYCILCTDKKNLQSKSMKV